MRVTLTGTGDLRNAREIVENVTQRAQRDSLLQLQDRSQHWRQRAVDIGKSIKNWGLDFRLEVPDVLPVGHLAPPR